MGMDRVEAAGGYAFDGLPRTRGDDPVPGPT